MRIATVWIFRPYLITAQLCGFGFVLYQRKAFSLGAVVPFEKTILPIPIFPGWRFAVVTPWN